MLCLTVIFAILAVIFGIMGYGTAAPCFVGESSGFVLDLLGPICFCLNRLGWRAPPPRPWTAQSACVNGGGSAQNHNGNETMDEKTIAFRYGSDEGAPVVRLGPAGRLSMSPG